MNTAQFAELLEPDVVQLLIQGAQMAGLSVNAYLRILMRRGGVEVATHPSKYTGTQFITTPTGVVVEVGCVTQEQVQEAHDILNIRELSQMDPDELTWRGREAWAREHGY